MLYSECIRNKLKQKNLFSKGYTMNRYLNIIFISCISFSVFSYSMEDNRPIPGSSPEHPLHIAPILQTHAPIDIAAEKRRIEQQAQLEEIRAEAQARAGSRGGGRGMVRGFIDLAKDKAIRLEITSGTKEAISGIEEVVKTVSRDKENQESLRRSTQEVTQLAGAATQGMREGLEEKVFPEMEKISQGAIGTVFNFKNAMQFGLPMAAASFISVTGTYGTILLWKYLEHRMLNPKPVILLPGSKVGRIDRFKRWWSGYKSPSIIFDASVKERLEEIVEKTKNIKNHIKNGENITYDNLLLYGNPGTGKTLFAQVLADYTDMDFLAVTAASLLQAGVEGIKYFDGLMMMANNSKYGIILFVDEADALFVDRDKLSPESDHYKVLNHILAATGSGSNKFMLVAATNHAYVMDPAMGRRFQDRVLMPLPDEGTRKELLVMYIDEQLFNTKTRKPQFISAAQAILTKNRIDEIAQQTQGLSHAEIKDMVTIMGKKANATKDGIITKRNVDSAVSEAIEKKKALEQDRLELEKKNRSTHMQQQPYMQPHIISEPEGSAAAA